MTTTQSAFVPAVVVPDFDSFAVRQAIAGFLAGYGDTTRDAYSLDLRQWLGWCTSHDLRGFAVRRAHIELFAQQIPDANERFRQGPRSASRRAAS